MTVQNITERLNSILPEEAPPMADVNPDPNLDQPLFTQEDLDNTPPLTYEPGNPNMGEGIQVASLFGAATDIIRNAIKKAPQKMERTIVPDAARQAVDELPITKNVGDTKVIPAASQELTDKIKAATDTRIETGAVNGKPPEEAFNLGNFQDEDLGALVGGVSDALGIKTTKVTFDEIKAQAKVIGIDEKFVNRLTDQNGQMMPNAVDTYRAMQVLESSAGELDRLFKMVADGTATESNRLQLRQQIALHGMIQRGVKGMQTETARALAVMRIPRDGNVDVIRNVLDEYGGDKSLNDMATAYLRLDASGRSKMMDKTILSGVKEVWFSTWFNGMLSNPVTHAKNIASNTLFGAYQIPERLIAAFYSNVLPKGVRDWKALVPGSAEEKIGYEEAIVMAQSIPQGMKRGFEMASKAWKNNAPNDPYSKIELLKGQSNNDNFASLFNIPQDSFFAQGLGYYSKAVTAPGRALITEDEFFKGTLYQMELNAQASRMGRKMYSDSIEAGMSEADAIAKSENYVTDILTNVPDDLDEKAMEFARKGTFTNKLPPYLEKLQDVFSHPILKIQVPYFKTPANIGLQVIERTPFAFLSSRWVNDIKEGGVLRDMAMAKVSLGSTFMAAFAGFAAEGTLSGSGPGRKEERDALERTGWRPYSRKVGDEWISYAGIEPVSALIAIAADYAEYGKYETDADKIDEVFLGGMFAMYEYLKEQPYMQGVADFGALIGESDSGKVKAGINALAKQLGGFVAGGSPLGPYNSMIAGIERLIDPTRKDTKADPDLPLGVKGFYEGLYKYKSRLPYFNKDIPDDLNMWGDPRQDGQGKAYEMVLPTRVSPEQFSPADDVLVRLGSPLSIKSFNKVNGVELNPVERNRFKEIYGKEITVGGMGIKEAIVEMANTPGFELIPLDQQQENIKSLHEQYAKVAKQTLLMESPELVQRIEKLKANREAFGIYFKQ